MADRKMRSPARSRGVEVDEQGRKLWLGFQMRQLRMSKKMSLQDLSELTSLSIAMLSQIERGKSSPSIRSLRLLSDALDVEPGSFFNGGLPPPSEEIGRIFRMQSFRTLHVGKGVRKQLITPQKGVLELVLVTIAPGGTSGAGSYTHKGEDAGYVIKGTLDLFIEEHKHVLRAGEAFRFKSSLPHRFGNSSKMPTQVLWVCTPPFY